jgi:hypothetical protein
VVDFKVEERRIAEELEGTDARCETAERAVAPLAMWFEGGEGEPEGGRRGGGVRAEAVVAIENRNTKNQKFTYVTCDLATISSRVNLRMDRVVNTADSILNQVPSESFQHVCRN